MDVISQMEFQNNVAGSFKRVIANHDALLVTQADSEPVVVMSLSDYNAHAETAYLLSSPANAKRLRQSIAHAKDGKVTEHELFKTT